MVVVSDHISMVSDLRASTPESVDLRTTHHEISSVPTKQANNTQEIRASAEIQEIMAHFVENSFEETFRDLIGNTFQDLRNNPFVLYFCLGIIKVTAFQEWKFVWF